MAIAGDGNNDRVEVAECRVCGGTIFEGDFFRCFDVYLTDEEFTVCDGCDECTKIKRATATPNYDLD